MSLRHTGKLTGENLNAAMGLVRGGGRKSRLKEKFEEPRRVGGGRQRQNIPTAATASKSCVPAQRACLPHSRTLVHRLGRACACARVPHSPSPPPDSQCDCAGLERPGPKNESVGVSKVFNGEEKGEERGRERTQEGCGGRRGQVTADCKGRRR